MLHRIEEFLPIRVYRLSTLSEIFIDYVAGIHILSAMSARRSRRANCDNSGAESSADPPVDPPYFADPPIEFRAGNPPKSILAMAPEEV